MTWGHEDEEGSSRSVDSMWQYLATFSMRRGTSPEEIMEWLETHLPLTSLRKAKAIKAHREASAALEAAAEELTNAAHDLKMQESIYARGGEL